MYDTFLAKAGEVLFRMQNREVPQLFLERGCKNMLFHAVCARPRASLHGLQSSSTIPDRVTFSLLLQHTALEHQLRQFSLKT